MCHTGGFFFVHKMELFNRGLTMLLDFLSQKAQEKTPAELWQFVNKKSITFCNYALRMSCHCVASVFKVDFLLRPDVMRLVDLLAHQRNTGCLLPSWS
jgi:hypothetical protein